MRKPTESIMMWLALAACGSGMSGQDVESDAAKGVPEAGTAAPAKSNTTTSDAPTKTTAGMPATAPSRTATAGSPSKSASAGAPSAGTATGSPAAGSGGAGAAAGAGGEPAAGSGGAAEPSGGEPGVPCEVSKALTAACHRCHGTVPANGAPMSLVTLEDFQTLTVGGKPRVPKYQAALNRMNGTKNPPMPPATSPITDEDKQTLIDWLGEGAPAGEANGCL